MSAPSTKPSKKNPHFNTIPRTKMHQIPSNNKSKSTLCKTLIVVLLLAIPMFPSQPPDEFISHQLWEIIHLLFIGIAVTYGLFSTKNANQTLSYSRTHDDDDGDSAYLSGISHLSSVFESGFGNVCVSDEQDNIVSGNCVGSGGGGSRRLEGKDGVFTPKVGSFRELVDGVERVGGAWRSQYSKGESLVVVSNGECFVDEGADFKPLNLPVRSLRSSVADDGDKTGLRRGGRCSPRLEAKSGVDGGGPKVVKIRGVTPMNLEKKFEEASGLSPIPWRSRSLRMVENEERVSGNSKPHVHYRPHSVGEFDFEHLNKSSSLQGLTFSSSPELLTSSRMGSTERKKDGGELNFSVSNPKKGPLDAEASLGGAKTRQFSNGVSSEMTVLRNVEYDLKNLDDHGGEEDKAVKGKRAIDSLGSDVKPPGLAKVLSRAKSVRTTKPSRYFVDGKEQDASEIDSKLGRRYNKLLTSTLVSRGDGREEPENDATVNSQNQESDNHIFPMPKPRPTPIEFHHTGKEEGGIDDDKSIADQSEEEKEEDDTESEADRSAIEDNVKSDNYVEISDAELGSEVDRKAGEFIAKFREQIRLQKMSSLRGHSGWQQL